MRRPILPYNYVKIAYFETMWTFFLNDDVVTRVLGWAYAATLTPPPPPLNRGEA